MVRAKVTIIPYLLLLKISKLLLVCLQFTIVENLCTAVADVYPKYHRTSRRPILVAAICSLLFLMGIILCTDVSSPLHMMKEPRKNILGLFYLWPYLCNLEVLFVVVITFVLLDYCFLFNWHFKITQGRNVSKA